MFRDSRPRCIADVKRLDAWALPHRTVCTGPQCPLKSECDILVAEAAATLNKLSLAAERWRRLPSGCG